MSRPEPEIDTEEFGVTLSARLLMAAVFLLVVGMAGLVGWLTLMPGTPASAPPHPIATAALPLPIPPPEPAPQAVVAPAPAPAPAATATAPAVLPPAPNQTAALPPPAAPSPPPPAAPPPTSRGKGVALAPAPDPRLVEKGALGPLPKIDEAGRAPWQVYAKPFDKTDRRPRIAIMITGVGLSGAATQAAINDLPGGVTLVFNPYSPNLDDSIARARAAGHEVFLSLPMEPADYPRDDPGPYTLLTSLDVKQNIDRLLWTLSRVTGYAGVASEHGSRFTTSKGDLLPVLDVLKARGLMFIDSRATERTVAESVAQSIGLPCAASNVTLDQDASRDAIDAHLQQLETLAKQNGSALGMGYIYPVTLERVAKWILTLDDKGIALAPASALAEIPGSATGSGNATAAPGSGTVK